MFRKALMVGVVSTCLVSPVLAQRPKVGDQGRSAQQQQTKRELRAQRQQQPKQRLQAKRKLRTDGGLHKLQRGLNLSDAQSEQLRGLINARDMEIQRLRTEGTKGRKGDARAVEERFRSDLRGILTPEQAEILDQKAGGRKK